MKLVILSTAEEDLVDGFTFYESQAPGAGEYFLRTLIAEIDSLPRHAGVHKKIAGKHRMLSRRFPVGIFYTVDAGTIAVMAVLDLRQCPSWISSKLKR